MASNASSGDVTGAAADTEAGTVASSTVGAKASARSARKKGGGCSDQGARHHQAEAQQGGRPVGERGDIDLG